MSLLPKLTSSLGRHVNKFISVACVTPQQSLIRFSPCYCSYFTSNSKRLTGSVKPSETLKTTSRFISTSQTCFKKKKSRAREEEEDEDREDEDDLLESELLGKGDKVLDVRMASDRIDAVLKAGLGMSRNKIEKAFYSDRVRVNGERPKKKSQTVDEGDEVDFIVRYNVKNPEYLDVSRLEILRLGPYPSPDDDEYFVPARIKRSKNLTIENYEKPFRGNISDD